MDALDYAVGCRAVGARQYDEELVAAPARYDVHAAHRRGQDVGERHERFVALGMTEGVVDALEIVHVEHHDRQRKTRGERILQEILEGSLHGTAVHQACESVALGEDDELAAHRLPFLRHGVDEMHEMGEDRRLLAELRRDVLVDGRLLRLALAESDAEHRESRLHDLAFAA